MICASRQFPLRDFHGFMAAMKPDLTILKDRIRRAGIRQNRLAELLGWDESRLSRILNGRQDPGLADYVELLDLIEKQEKSVLDSSRQTQARTAEPSRPGFEAMPPETARPVSERIPVYGLVGAAANGAIHLNHTAVITTTARHPAQGSRDDVFALEVWNESMSPRYEPGELVYCVRGRLPRRGQDCVVELKSGDAFLKIYVKQEGSQIFTRQLNPEDEVRFDATTVKAVHAVVGRG